MARAAQGVLALLAALTLLGSQALSALHYTLVPHHLCALHGVLEDGTSKVSAAESSDSDRPARAEETGDANESDEHEACTVAALTEPGAAPQRAAFERAAAESDFVALEPASADLKPDRATLLARAPKLSPPAQA